MSDALVDKQRIRLLSPDNARTPRREEPEPAPPSWRPAPGLPRAVAIAGVCLLLAVALGRADLVALAAPFVIGTCAVLAARPRQAPSAELRLDSDRVAEGEEFSARVVVSNADSTPMFAVTSVYVTGGLRLRHGAGRYVDPLPSGTEAAVELRGLARRWGSHSLGPVTVAAVACDGLLRATPARLSATQVRVFPRAEPFDSRQTLPQAAGMAGIHRSRRLGDGGELAEVRRFQPGDRLRRIDWRVSLRQRELHVNTTLSERDADIVIVLDLLHEAESQDSPSILDNTVRAAAAITEHYAQQGDRVSIVEFGPTMRRLRPGTGRRHFIAACEWLVDVRVMPGGAMSARRLVSTGHLRSGAVVIMLTPLIDSTSTEGVVHLARSGRQLLTVDTLPSTLNPPIRGEWTETASRLWRLERDNTIAQLRELGVAVAPWRGAGSLDTMLRDLAQLSRTQGTGRR